MTIAMSLSFCKMHGLGNDFILIDACNKTIDLNKTFVKFLANRHLGIGFDQLLLIEKSSVADFACRIFNSDGSEAEQCGNGLRCAARFIQETNLSNKNNLSIETKAGIFNIVIHDYNHIQVTMSVPIFKPKLIHFLVEKQKNIYAIEIKPGHSLPFAVLSMGNPHAILRIPSLKNYPVIDIAHHIANHPAFPQSVNVGFIEIVSRQLIYLRTVERGAGETYACGSNACAAVVAGILNGWLDNSVTVQLTYGSLLIEWEGENQPVIMTGSATRVFTGTIDSFMNSLL
jgi:diaminopimelate epimerase